MIQAETSVHEPAAIPSSTVDPDGTVHIQPIQLPLSPLLSSEARQQMIDHLSSGVMTFCPLEGETWEDSRDRVNRDLFDPIMAKARERYPCDIEDTNIKGSKVRVVRSRRSYVEDGRVLIHMHCGGFVHGASFFPDALAMAEIMGVEVISVDYCLPPEWKLQQAVDDVVNVYTDAIDSRDPQQVGIWGTSAGGVLASMAMSACIQSGLPVAGALGLVAASGGMFWGDSGHISPATMAYTVEIVGHEEDFKSLIGANPKDSMFGPMYHLDILESFPPTMLTSSTRASELSGVLVTHRNLLRARNVAELHVWEGLPHAFNTLTWLPEAHDLHETLARFFDRHLVQRS